MVRRGAGDTVWSPITDEELGTGKGKKGKGKEKEKRMDKPIYIKAKTPLGTLSAELSTDPDYPGLTIYWNARQIAVVEPHQTVIRVMVWDNDEDDPSTTVTVSPGYGE